MCYVFFDSLQGDLFIKGGGGLTHEAIFNRVRNVRARWKFFIKMVKAQTSSIVRGKT